MAQPPTCGPGNVIRPTGADPSVHRGYGLDQGAAGPRKAGASGAPLLPVPGPNSNRRPTRHVIRPKLSLRHHTCHRASRRVLSTTAHPAHPFLGGRRPLVKVKNSKRPWLAFGLHTGGAFADRV
jgi:hypothetical protein